MGRILVNFTVSTVSSLMGQDYTLSQDYIMMEDGEIETYINITIIDDDTPELNEVIQFSLTSVELIDPMEIVTLPPDANNPGNVEVRYILNIYIIKSRLLCVCVFVFPHCIKVMGTGNSIYIMAFSVNKHVNTK